jgi:chemotaxis protein CheX
MSDTTNSQSVLIADSDPILRETVSTSFKNVSTGVKILNAPSIKDMVAKAANQKFDLLVADTRLEKIGGSDVLEYISKIPENNQPLNIFVISETADEFELLATLPTATLFRPPLDTALLEKNFREALKIPIPVPKPVAKKGGIDTDFVNPFFEATLKALKGFAKVDFARQNLFIRTPQQPSGDISGLMPIDSPVYKGSFSVSFEETTFCKVATAITQREISAITPEVHDVAAEVCNQIFGLAKKALNDLGHSVKTSLPTVIAGKAHSVSHSTQGACIAVRFSSPVGGIQIEIVLHPVS